MAQFVTSDQHIWHKNIIKFNPESRPFDTIQEHNAEVVKRHNEVVSPEDEVYFLGDFAFGSTKQVLEFLNAMNGIKYYIFGNHDRVMRSSLVAAHFVWMKDYHELDIPGYKHNAILSHYPMMSWNKMHYGALHFYGHTHCDIAEMHSGRGRDVGLDSNNCYPWAVRDLVALMDPLEIVDARGRSVKR